LRQRVEHDLQTKFRNYILALKERD
jgi:hypothetical protein